MLPWSRAPRFRLVSAVAFAAVCLLAVGAAAPLYAQEQLTRAVLESGPTAVKGIPVYAPNRISAFRGEYSLEGEQGTTEARTLRVLYTRQDLLIPQNWIRRRCGVDARRALLIAALHFGEGGQ